MTSLFGIQMPAPERAAEPPKVGAFSTTTTLRPRLARRSAAVIPAAPQPITTTSNCWAASPGLAAAVDPTARPVPTAAAPARSRRRLRGGGIGAPQDGGRYGSL